MKKKLNYFAAVLLTLTVLSCADEMANVLPKNSPSFDALSGEVGMASLAKGGVYVSGFGGYYGTIDDGLGVGFQILAYGMHESMGDNVFVPWGNNNFKYLDNPTDFKFDNGSTASMSIGTTQPFETKLRNSRSYGATNSMLVEWTYMYVMNNSMNIILDNIDKAKFTGDVATKKATFKAWARFWKGYAYSRIGSMYIAGLIIDKPGITNGNFVTNTAIIAEAKNQFTLARTELATITGGGVTVYTDLMKTMIPDYCVQNRIPTPTDFIHNANTMEARNILASKKLATAPGPLPAMTVTDWDAVKTLTTAGIAAGEGIFVIKTFNNLAQSVIDPYFGAVGPYAATPDATYYISEKLIQDIRVGDRRFDQNFDLLPSPQVNIRGRGYNFGTRWQLVDEGTGAFPATLTYCHIGSFGVDSHYMAGSWEENSLMLAESTMNGTGPNIAAGCALIDAVRTGQGAGLAPIVPGTLAAAMEEIRSERRIALLFRSVAFYDARRLGIIVDKASGGGRGPGGALNVAGYDHATGVPTTGAVVLHETTGVNRNAFINYNYLNYWDVPQNELEYNAPASGSSVVVSPN